jgi:hypothetical protein
MSALKKAYLQEIKADKSAAPISGTEIEVQFNPQSLKLALANKVEGGDTRGRQNRQYLGKTSTTLSFDLHFDTADEGTTDAPVSVRTRTAAVERFVLPKGQGNQKQAPPKVRFHWDKLVIDGIIEDVTIDFDLFAANGTPLRAKMGVSIKEQDSKYELLQSGPGANQAGNAPPSGAGGNGPGSSGSRFTDSSAAALDGESVADFTARMGLDPAAWRGIAGNLDASSSLSLQAGLSVDFNASLSASAGIGVSVGLEAGANVSFDTAFGLEANASAVVSTGGALSADASAGFALSAAGGVGAALETVAVIRAEAAAQDTRRSFSSAVPQAPSAPPPAAVGTAVARGTASIPATSAAAIRSTPGAAVATSSPRPAAPDQSRTPLVIGGLPSPLEQAAAPSAPPPPLADPRSNSFGFGVPLRPRVGSAADLRTIAAAGRVPLRPRSRLTEIPQSRDPTIAPWAQLPVDRNREFADHRQRQRYPMRPCGCGGGCSHGGRPCQCRSMK